MSETIAAISTPPGEGGIGIVRISGPESESVMKRMMLNHPDFIEPRHAYFGKVVSDSSDINNDGSEIIDEALFIYMKAPHSYTGEDMLEIQGHGSNVSLRRILYSVLNKGNENIRMAEPGEFTKLAFLNGKMDLSQAEAVIDIIKAKSDLSLEIAQGQREGRLSYTIRSIREQLLDILAQMAVHIDFPEEDEENTGHENYDDTVNDLIELRNKLIRLADTASIGRIAKEGVRAAIIGKPNAGKSSLMNAVLGEGRVIVTDVPGTTRDTVEESAVIGGIPIVLVDTAGLRDTDDKVEKIGIDRSIKAASSADIVILVIDGSEKPDDEDIRLIDTISRIDPEHMIVVINKEDLGLNYVDDIKYIVNKAINDKCRFIITSLLGNAAMDAAVNISDTVADIFESEKINLRETNIISNQRHLELLNRSIDDINESINILSNGEPVEVAELSAHYAYEELGRIIGEEIEDEVLDTVFSKFCLGK